MGFLVKGRPYIIACLLIIQKTPPSWVIGSDELCISKSIAVDKG
jgi:hypothetical protein